MTQKSKFQEIVETIAEDNEWSINEIDEAQAVIDFETESGSTQTLYISLMEDEMVEFDIPSAAIFESEDDIAHEASSLLLKRNANRNYGYWALEEIEEKWCFSFMFMTDLEVLEASESEAIGQIVDIMVDECGQFDQIWNEMMQE
ncbi:MAG TPA: hypothetical protein PKW33_10200 [Anaerolineaceae bacterium]|nr:hypothetical protein [Anaerolineaceae bacterium]HPN51947.1 hypothetical protein [Anaerolineaceae bacterium]